MPRRRYIFDPPERFVAGTVGEPGDRTFFLQARDGGRVVSVVLEKVQVAVLADRLNRLLDELDQRGVTAAVAPVASVTPDAEPLDEPVVEAFRAGTLTLGWDGTSDRVLVEARAQTEDDDEATEADDVLPDDDAEDHPEHQQATRPAGEDERVRREPQRPDGVRHRREGDHGAHAAELPLRRVHVLRRGSPSATSRRRAHGLGPRDLP